MSLEADSIRACVAEAKETVTLTQKFYSCVVKDPRTSSGEFEAAKPQPVPTIEGLSPAEEHADALDAMEAAIESLDEAKASHGER